MATTKRKHWRRRLDQTVRLLLAAAMVLQLSAGGLGVAFAASYEEAANVRTSEAQVQADEDSVNLVANGDFSQGSEGWTPLGAWNFDENGASTTTTGAGADWSTMLKYTVQLEESYQYEVSVTLTSTVERNITMDIGDMEPREYTSDIIPANEETTITYTSERGIGGGRILGIYLGGQDYGEHTVTITNVSVVRGDKIKMPGEDTDDGNSIDEVAGNLLPNGSFANKGDGWEVQTANADIYFNAYRTVFYLKGNAADWQQGLKCPLNLDSGKYVVTFTVEASVERTVSLNLRDVETGNFYTSPVLPAGEPTTLSFITDGAARDGGTFYLYLGGADAAYPHSVVVSDISVVEKPIELANDENDEAPAPIASIKDTTAAEQTILKDGAFTQGLAMWETWAESWFNEWDVVKYTPTDDGLRVYIGNVGDGEKNLPWDVQLNQHINLKAGLAYTLSFDVSTEKARAFNVVINDPLDNSIFSRTVGLQAGESRHVVFNIPVQETDALNYLFSFQMGSNNHTEVRENTLTFQNVKIEVNGYSGKAVLVDDGEFTQGLGGFTADDSGRITAQDDSVIATGSALSREISGMEPGMAYVLSFMAGSVDAGTITVALPNGEEAAFDLTDETKLCTAEFISNGETGALTFAFDENNIICLDTVRLDVKGYADAIGLDVTRHDITRLTKNAAPLLSEMALAEFGKDVVLAFASDEEYEKSITSVTVDGQTVEYTVESGQIILSKDLFVKTAGGDRQTYDITVSAYWYTDNRATQIVYDPGVFTPTWADEFNGDALDTAKWGYQDGTGAEYGLDGWGNNEQQYYTRDNLTVGDGAMTITATKGTHGKPYDSARIWTQNQAGTENYFAQTYGRFEAKMKLPAGDGCQGLWPAFWLLPVDTSIYGGWPLSGEIDIMEARGREGNKADGTIHYGRPWPNDGGSGDHMEWDDPLAITDYHIYSVDWTPTYMSFQVDGVEYYRAENWYSQSDDQPSQYAFPAPFDQDFYIIFNIAVGGTYDGNLNPDASALPAEMKVDYVRVYQFNDLPADDVIVPDPVVEPEAIPAGAKDSIIDPGFTDVKKVVNDGDPKNADGWNLLTLNTFGGAADFSTVTVNGQTFAKVNITNGGSQNYSVQFTQRLELYYGNWYTLSFDAYADSPREIIAKIAADGTNGNWSTYNSVTSALTREVRHYEYTFQMLERSNPYSRLEMNMGFGTGPVYIANVEFKSAEGLEIDHDVSKTPLESGEGIYNGAFNLGTTDRLAYWYAEGGEVAKSGTAYYFQAGAGGAALSQTGIELLQSDTYRLNAAVSGSVSYAVTSADGGAVYADGELSNTQEFAMPAGVTDKNAVITFKLTAGATLDDISLFRTTYNNVDYSGLDCYPVLNGDFEHGELGWGAWGTSLSVVEEAGGNHTGQVSSVGANRWDALLSQDLHFLGGYTYELTFRAKSNQADTVIDLSMEDANHSRSFEQTNIKVGAEWNEYKYTFKFNADKDLSLKFLVGGGNFTLSLDDVEIKLMGAPAKPGAFVANGYNRAEATVTVLHTGTEKWTEKAVLTLNGEPISSELYQFADGKLMLDASLFPASGEYVLAARAEGYADSKAAILVYPANGDLIKNGDFTNGQEYWTPYNHNGVSCELDYALGYLNAYYNHAEGDSWGNMAISWSIQSNQKGIVIPEDGTYELHFMASSEVERYIIAEMAGKKVKVWLTNEWEEHTVTYENVKAGTYELALLMGTVNPEEGKENFSAAEYGDTFQDFASHSFYLDNISLIPAESTYTTQAVPTSIKLTGNTNVTQGETAAVNAALAYPIDGTNQPTGSVAFYLNGEELNSESGELALDTSSLSEGVYTIRAVYVGDENFGSSEAEFTVTVAKKAEEPDTPEEPGTPSIPVNPGNPGRPTAPSNPSGEDIGDDSNPPLAEKPFLFTDVDESNGYYDAIRWAVNNDITNGITETLFGPNRSCTRAQIVTFLWRAAGEPEVKAVETPFTDIDPNGYYYDAVLWAVSEGIVRGHCQGHH